jgi:thiamine biosynthesis protein ThiI
VIPEYCGVISVKPTTRAKRGRIAHEEERFDFSVLERAIHERVSLDIRTMQANDDAESVAVQFDDIATIAPDKLVVIDIRHPDQQERHPLLLPEYPIHKLPFYSLNTKFPALAQDRHYLLYCDKGVMSRLHASHLREQGYANVGIYRK